MTATARRNGKPRTERADLSPGEWVLGSILLYPPHMEEAARRLRVTDFRHEHEQVVFRAMLDLHRAKSGIDVLLLKKTLDANGKLSAIEESNAALLMRIAKQVPTAAHFRHYLELMLQASLRLRVRKAAEALAEGAADPRRHSSELVNELGATFEDLHREAMGDDALIAHLHDATTPLSNGEPIPYLVPAVLPAGQFGVVAAKSKSLKTKTVLDLAISLATGTEFLGRWPTPRTARVYFLSREITGAVLDHWVEDICAAKGLVRADLGNLILDDATDLDLSTPQGLTTLRRIVERHDRQVAFLDPTNFLLPGIDLNSLPEMTAHLNAIKRVSDDTGAAIGMVHHNRKNAQDYRQHFAPPTLSDIHGSGFAQVVRWWVLLNRRREWDAENRKHFLHLVMGGSAGHASQRWYDAEEGRSDRPEGTFWHTTVLDPQDGADAAAEAKEAAEALADAQKWERRKRACCEALAAAGVPITKTKMFQAAKISTRYRDDLLEMLTDEGGILPVGDKYRLADD